MEHETPTTERSPGEPTGPLPRGGVVPASVDAAGASTLASSLKRRRGNVVVTAPFATTAGRLFEMAERQLGATRVVRLSARLLVETEVARAIAGVTQRGLPPPSPSVVAGVAADTRRRGESIVILVDDGDALQLDRLERVREMLDRTADLRAAVRLVVLGGPALRRMLQTPEAKTFVDGLALHLDVSGPAAVTVAPSERRAPPPRRRAAREPSWLMNEKLLVLAVGAVLVTGVLLFPVEPSVYPPGPGAEAPGDQPVAAASTSNATPAAADGTSTSDATPPAGAETLASDAGEQPAAAVPEAPVRDAAEPPAAQAAAQFRPPTQPGPALQVGAFRSRANAERLARRLSGDFEGVYIDRLGEGTASLHRVRIPIGGSLMAETALATALKERGLTPVRVE